MISFIYESTTSFQEFVATPPNALWFIVLVSMGVSLFSTILNKVIVDHDQLNRQQLVITEHAEKKKILLELSETNPAKYAKLYRKWQRRDESLKKMQQKMSMTRLKPTCVTFIPMIVFFYVIRNMYTSSTGVQVPIGKLPMNPMQEFPELLTSIFRSEFYSSIRHVGMMEGWAGFSGFYFLTSLSLSPIMQKIFGISKPKGQQSMSGMFDTKAQMDLPNPKDLGI